MRFPNVPSFLSSNQPSPELLSRCLAKEKLTLSGSPGAFAGVPVPPILEPRQS